MERQEISNLSFLTGKWPLKENKLNLIFIHDVGATAMNWIFQIKEFAEKFNIIVLDLPGHGKSQGPGMNNVQDYAKKIAYFLNEINAGKFIVIGTSMGGAIAMQLLVDYADKFTSGVLLNTGAKLAVLPTIFEAILSDFKAFVTGMSDFLFPATLNINEDISSLMDMLEIKQKVVLDDFTACHNFDIRKRLHEIKVPVLVISAKNDIMTPVWYGEYLTKNINNANFILVDGAGHLAHVEKPEIVNKAITEFISLGNH